jgi:PTH1 family peptidyl-tRNA hydrolase
MREVCADMYIIAGLGNPGKEYDGTRHNIGFTVIDELADAYNINVDKKECKGLTGRGVINGNKVLLVKPQTYMNNSGECLRAVLDYYKEDVDSLLVVYDDICLDVGRLRLRPRGSAGGHNGIKSIIAHLGTQEFSRLRFGVGDKPKEYDLVDWVLGHFPRDEFPRIREGIDRAVKAVGVVLDEGIEAGMNQFNAR